MALRSSVQLDDRSSSGGSSLAPVFVWTAIAGLLVWGLAIWKLLEITGVV